MDKQQQKQMLTEIMNEDAKDGLYNNKPFTTGSLRKITDACEMGYISYGRMVEMINEIAIKWHENHIVDTNKMVKHHIVDINKMITMAQHTALEQLISLLQSERNKLEKAGDKSISVGLYAAEIIALQLLKMEKEQIMKSFISGGYDGLHFPKVREAFDRKYLEDKFFEYFKETYG